LIAASSSTTMGTTYKCCLIFKRRFHTRDAPPPEDVRALFSLHAGGGPHMGADGLRRYLDAHHQDQDQELDDAEVERLLEQIRLQQQQGRARLPRLAGPLLTLDDFHRYLFSHDLNPPLRHHAQAQVHHDMTQPLSHYFIYTGHNSYLTGNQLSSDCSDVPIIKALQRGVRVIELDMWPNSTRDDINILHGR
jgi:phosphatidylinositol phospholipase C delta